MHYDIMIVDDSEAVRIDVSDFFKKHNFSVAAAIDGIDALTKLKKYTVRVLITDINMPNMDGLELIERVRGELGVDRDQMEILILTTENNEPMKERARASKIKGWIVKPFSGPAALEPIKKMIG